MFKTMRRLSLIVFLCVAVTSSSQAQGLPGVPTGTVMTEVMMDVQGSEALLYGALLGASPGSSQSISGTTSVDTSSGAFSFSLNPGSSYLGQSISDSVQGQFNPATSSYSWTGSGASGGVNWMVQGNVTPIELDLSGPKWQLEPSVQIIVGSGGLGGSLALTDQVTIYGPGQPTPALSSKVSTLSDLAGNIISQTSGLDIYDGTTGTLKDLTIPTRRYPLVLFADQITDQTPITGGPGTYTTTVTVAPEQSSLLIGLVSGLGALVYLLWSRDRQARSGAC
jgi:hypothetical protein